MGRDGPVLVINAGSSSVKYALFDGGLNEILAGSVEIAPEDSAWPRAGAKRPPGGAAGRCPAVPPDMSPDHAQALARILARLEDKALPVSALAGAAHRVVHGGARLTAPCRITPETLAGIRACIPLAPLHNPHNLAAVEALAALAPDLPQFASFDTAFHATNPPVARRFAIPEYLHKSNIRRFGFHGISYRALVDDFPAPLPERLLALHLGNGASICAIRKGRSVATTMGCSPLDGLTMGTRPGSLDAGAVLEIVARLGLEEARDMLNRRSGLLALSGIGADMRALLDSDAPEAAFAVEHFCYWAARHAGSMIAAMQGVDAIAFTGGIGENAEPVRARILELLAWTGVARENIHVIPAREERRIAADALQLMRGDA